MRTLDDVYGAECDRFPLEQEMRWRIVRLDWDEVEPIPLDREGSESWYFSGHALAPLNCR